MGTRHPIIEESFKQGSYNQKQFDFTAGIWNDIPAVTVPVNGLSDGENVRFIDLKTQFGVAGRYGTHVIINPDSALTSDPLAWGYIPEAADGQAYFVIKQGTKLYYCTHDSSTPTYFTDGWTEILGYRKYQSVPVFTGAGLDDMVCRGYPDTTTNDYYRVRIFSEGTPDTFEWSNDDGSTWDDNSGAGYAITGSSQELENNIKVKFTATTGHTEDEYWRFQVIAHESASLTASENSYFSNDGDKLILHDTSGIYEIGYDTDASAMKFYKMNNSSFIDSGAFYFIDSDADYTGSYFRKYAVTLARIVDGVILHESPANNFSASGNKTTSYAIQNSTSIGDTTIALSQIPDLTSLNDTASGYSAYHWTHAIIYSTTNLVFDNDDIDTGNIVNNADPERFIKNVTIELESGGGFSTTVDDAVTDSQLQANEQAGLILRSRFLEPLTSSNIGTICNGFLFSYDKSSDKIRYSGLYSPQPQNRGYCLMGDDGGSSQWIRAGGHTTALRPLGTQLIMFYASGTDYLDTTLFSSGGSLFADNQVPILGTPTVISSLIGVPAGNIGTIAFFGEEKTLIMAATNNSVRYCDGNSWSYDLLDSKYKNDIENMPAGAVAAYGNGIYYLWYRSDASQSTYNNSCIALDYEKKNKPWTKITGTTVSTNGKSFPFPTLYVGAITINYYNKALTCCYRRLYGTGGAVDRRMYWIDTFDSTANTIFTEETTDQYYENSTAYTADIICTWTTRGWKGSEEDNFIILRKFTAYWSYDIGRSAYLSSFACDLTYIMDGTEYDTLENIKTNSAEKKDIAPSWMKDGNILQLKFTTNKTAFLFRGYKMLLDEIEGYPYKTAENADWISNQSNLSDYEYRGCTFRTSSLGTASGGYYTSGSFQERWNGGTFDFSTATGEGKFKFVTGPDGVSNSAIEVLRNTGSGTIGFLEEFSSALTTDTMSIHFFGKTSSTSYENALIYAANSDLTPTPIYVQIKSTKLRIYKDASNYIEYDADFTSWVHVVITLTGGTYTVYLDKTATSSSASAGTVTFPSDITAVWIGNAVTATKAIDLFEIVHYDSVLTAADIAYIYNDVVNNEGEASLGFR